MIEETQEKLTTMIEQQKLEDQRQNDSIRDLKKEMIELTTELGKQDESGSLEKKKRAKEYISSRNNLQTQLDKLERDYLKFKKEIDVQGQNRLINPNPHQKSEPVKESKESSDEFNPAAHNIPIGIMARDTQIALFVRIEILES